MSLRRLLGLMSGTSADGLSMALVGVPRRNVFRLLAFRTVPYPAGLRRRLLRLPNVDLEEVRRLDLDLAASWTRTARAFLRAHGGAVDGLGSHGHTVLHRPPRRGCRGDSWQIGNAAILAEGLGAPVVSDFRAGDLAAGGQGAPLVPFVDGLLFRHPRRDRILLNLGGIANFTLVAPREGVVVALDCGPGGLLLDDAWRRARGTRGPFDRGGRVARRGRVDAEFLRLLLGWTRWRRPPPRSLDRAEVLGWAERCRRALDRPLRLEDELATLTRLTVARVAGDIRRYVRPRAAADEVLVSGGGARNAFLVEGLARAVAPTAVRSLDGEGIPAEAKEAFAFAVLAWHRLRGLPAGCPAATGAAHAALLGAVTLPPVPARL